jgi:hypothetical protein
MALAQPWYSGSKLIAHATALNPQDGELAHFRNNWRSVAAHPHGTALLL